MWPCFFSDILLQVKISIITCSHLEKMKIEHDKIICINGRGSTMVDFFSSGIFFFSSVISRDASDPKNEEFTSIQREISL